MEYTEKKQLVVGTDYADLFVVLNPEYLNCTDIPIYDKFILKKEISYRERRLLDSKKDYIILSNKYNDQYLDRYDIVEFITQKIKSRRKVKPEDLKHLTDEDFIEKCKLFYVLGVWDLDENADVTIFDLFTEINNANRFKVYHQLLENGHYPRQILYSLLTFASKAHSDDFSEYSKGYGKVLSHHSALVKKNFSRALNSFNKLNKQLSKGGKRDTVSENILVLNFIDNLGSTT